MYVYLYSVCNLYVFFFNEYFVPRITPHTFSDPGAFTRTHNISRCALERVGDLGPVPLTVKLPGYHGNPAINSKRRALQADVS